MWLLKPALPGAELAFRKYDQGPSILEVPFGSLEGRMTVIRYDRDVSGRAQIGAEEGNTEMSIGGSRVTRPPGKDPMYWDDSRR